MNQTHHCDVAVIGGGAAGLSAAIFAAQTLREAGSDASVTVVDGARRLGAKILVAGGGRCNVTHHHVTPEDYNGPRKVIRNVLRAFDEHRTVAWFASLGVELRREPTGKLFPVTDQARTVLDALLTRCRQLGVMVLTGHRVADCRMAEDRWHVACSTCDTLHQAVHVQARRVVLATGGRSLPRTGSDGGAYAMLARLGHTVTDTHAALVPLVLDAGFFHAALSGISHEVDLATFVDGRQADRRTGSLLWTHFGISGPVVMDASRHWVIADDQGRQGQLRANLLPGRSFADVDRLLQPAGTGRTLGQRLAALLPRRVADAIVSHAGASNATAMNQLSREHRRSLVHALTDLHLPVVRHRGWNDAEVTAGGVPLAEVDHRTMASRRADRLHLIGELLDVDGRIGGFNFQWAWATGHLAGVAAARALLASG